MAIQQTLEHTQDFPPRKDVGRPMYGTSYGRTTCGRCGKRVPYGQAMIWFRLTGWIDPVCWQNDPRLPHAYQGSS
jgi:hypothetical protein